MEIEFGSAKRARRSLLASAVACIFALTLLTSAAFGKGPKAEENSVSSSFSATHVLGLPNTHPNASGSLSVDGESLYFATKNQGSEVISIPSIEGVFLSEQDKQVGGVPMTLGKAAVPFGGGRVVSLFSHKKYDDIAVIYRDDDGGVHGAVFQLRAGEGNKLQDKLVSKGARLGPAQDAVTGLPTPEVVDASK